MIGKGKIAGVLVCIIFLTGCASFSVVEQDRNFQKTFENVGLNKNEIFTKSLQWLAKTYTDAKEVIEFQDIESGKIIGRGMSTVIFNPALIAPMNVNIQYTLTIDIKDDRLRIAFSNFHSNDISGGNIMEDNYLKLEPRLQALSLDLYNYLKTIEEW